MSLGLAGRHTGDGEDRRVGICRASRAPPRRAAAALLPHARILRGRRGSRPGDVAPRMVEARHLPAPLDVPRVAVRDRHERLPRRPPHPLSPGDPPGPPLPPRPPPRTPPLPDPAPPP